MKQKPDPRAQLLSDAFHDDWASGPAHAFALRAAAAARRNRMRRKLVAGGASLAVATTILIFAKPVIEASWSLVTAPAARTANATSAGQTATPSTAMPSFEIISDEELHIMLRGRPMLILPDAPNGPRVVVLSR